jgi:lipopolysaccharide export system permease protein
MKKLLFLNFLKDTLKFFILVCFSIGIIVWVIQAVSYLDFVTEDGHGLSVYFSYTILNFPKIIHRILPFVFFISLFYQINQYEMKNELIIFWTNGINKLQFINAVLVYSFIFLLIQIILGAYISPFSQHEARSFIRSSNVDFFPSLIKEGKFIDAVNKLTIFIDKKDKNGNYQNIFLEENYDTSESFDRKKSQRIYAKSGSLINTSSGKYLELYSGNVVNTANGEISNFSFEKINFDLTKYGSKSTSYPKIQELDIHLLVQCLYYYYLDRADEFYDKNEYLQCVQKNIKTVTQEVFKRLYKPIYILLLGLISSLVILKSKEDSGYNNFKILLFLIMIIIIILSEVSLRYISYNLSSLYFYVLCPIIIFLIVYTYLIKKLNTGSKI